MISINIALKKSAIFLLIFSMFGLISCNKKSFIETVKESNVLAIHWLKNNMRRKGIFVYQYNVKRKRRSRSNNMIRQLMGSRLLAELSQSDSQLRILHRKNLHFIFKYWYKEKGNMGYIYYNKKSKLGAIGMALRTLVYSPYFEEYKDKAQKLCNSILSLMDNAGGFKPFFIEPKYKYCKKRMLYFYSGEAILSLVEYAEKIKDKNILNTAIKAQDYYIDEYVLNLEHNYYPAYVPWHTQSLNKLYKITNNRKYAESIFVLNDELLKIQDRTEYIGRFYHPKFPQYGVPHSASDGVYTEGLACAYEIAQLVEDKDRQKKYAQAIRLGVQNLISLQYKDGDKRQKGAFKYRDGKDIIRIDTTQHTIDAYMKILKVYKEEKTPPDRGPLLMFEKWF